MKKRYILFLVTVFLVQACENKAVKTTEKAFLEEESLSEKTEEETSSLPTESTKYSIDVEKIGSIEYHLQKVKANYQNTEIKKITDFKVAKKLLVGIVKFDERYADYPMVSEINFINGIKPKHKLDNELDECTFKAYFPDENILLCEGGHTVDISFNLINGQETEETGNPDYIKTTPNKLFRLNGNYNGQQCSSYFIQKKTNKEFKKIIELDTDFEKQTKIWLCVVGNSFWKDDKTLYLTEESDYTDTGLNKRYFKIKLIEK